MKISEEDILHGIWMLEHQIQRPEDLIRFWKLFGPAVEEYPRIERMRDWYLV